MWKKLIDLIKPAVSGAVSGVSVYVLIGVAVLSAGGTGYVVYKIEHAHIETLKAEMARCTNANKSNEVAITKMSADREKAEKICQDRLQVKEATLRKFNEIDNLKGDTTHAETDSDPVVLALNELFRADH